MTAVPPPEPICVRVNEAARMIGVGRTKLYAMIAAGEVDTVKLGKATRITTASLYDLVRRQRGAWAVGTLPFLRPCLSLLTPPDTRPNAT